MKMSLKETIKRSRDFTKKYRIEHGKDFKLSQFDPADMGPWKKDYRHTAEEVLEMGVNAISNLQTKLYADSQWAVLLILQAMDAAGKDGIIKHVFSGVNPQGCKVVSFKSPSSTELRHDYLWRCNKELPERGFIGIFNRSYYEEVLSVKVHPDFLAAQNLPKELLNKDLWKNRYEDITSYERYLNNNGIVPVKIFLHLSEEEQRKRFLARIDDESKNWKFSDADLKERGYWNNYLKAIEQMIKKTATPTSPWYVVPADNKWYSRIIVMSVLVQILAKIDPRFPALPQEKIDSLANSRQILEKE